VPPETPVMVHSDDVDVDDVIKLRRRKTVSEKRRGSLRSNSLAENKAGTEDRWGSALGSEEPPECDCKKRTNRGKRRKLLYWSLQQREVVSLPQKLN